MKEREKMVKLELKNLKEIENEEVREGFVAFWKEKQLYVEELFKNYDKDLTLEVIVDKSGKTYKISASLNLNSKKILTVEEGPVLMSVTEKLFSEFKKTMKRQKELERKDYLYKRKR